jgi:quinol monooxygenase YgiN
MSNKPAILINVLKVEPEKQEALMVLLKQNIDAVVRTLDGWQSSRLIAAADRTSVVIYSEWHTPAAIDAMRNDPRMKAYLPKILALASIDSLLGATVLSAGEEHPNRLDR